MTDWERQEWESRRSSLPYYRREYPKFQERLLPGGIATLAPGVYLARFQGPVNGEALLNLGYASLPRTVVLDNRYVGNRWRLDSSNCTRGIDTARIEDLLPCPEGKNPVIHTSDLGLTARALHRQVAFHHNRLFWTLPEREADLLMQDWVEACFLGDRCVRVGVFYERDEDRARDPFEIPRPAGFVAIRKIDATTEAIDLIGVAQTSRGQGIGKALVQWAIEMSAGERLQVRTEEWNRAALSVYRHCGFRVQERERQFWARMEA